jgi:hypothetical protein
MFDTETLATTADACIMSIGAVRFDLDSGLIDDNGFYASISVDSNLELKRRISEDTLIWWMKQGAAAQGVFHEGKQMLRPALEALSDWIGNPDCHVWSNGGDFDIPMLAHAFTQCGMTVPWKFWNTRCFRTYKNLPGAKHIRSPVTGVKHNALSDAHQQVVTLQAIHKTLFLEKKHAMVKA